MSLGRTAELLLDALPDRAAVLDELGRVLFLNRAWSGAAESPKLGGCFFAYWEGQTVEDRDQQQRFGESLSRLLNGERSRARFDGTVLELGKNRSFRLEARLIDGQLFLLIQSDRTAEFEKLAALKARESRAVLLADAATDAAWDWDLENDLVWWSDGYQRLFGYPTDGFESVTESWSMRIHPDDRQRVLEGIQAVIDGRGETWEGEYQFLCSDGSYSTVRDRGTVVRDPQGRPQRMVGGMTDISERKKLEQQFLRAQRMESIGSLAGGIAHDLNNILAPIMMSLEVLRGEVRSDSGQETLTLVESSARRGAELVKQVLSFARGVHGEPVTLDPSEVARDIAAIVCDTFPKGISLQFDVPPDLWRLHMDPTQLHQILMNLCVNARDAMEAGGRLTLALENVLLDEIYSGLNLQVQPGPYVVLRVEDTGQGIEPEIQNRIFEPFYSTKSPGQGTGLGLSTVYSLVKGLGGFINLYSEIGKGTRFKVYLPADIDGKEATESPPVQGHLPRGRGELVLIVDDEESVREVTRKALERFGYRTILARHGAEGVSMYAQHRDDVAVVLTDMSMPIMDGASMIVALRSIDPEVKVIASSGLNANGHLVRALGSGVDHFVAKPYTAENLLTVLDQLLNPAQEESVEDSGEHQTFDAGRDGPAKPLLFVDDEPTMRQMGRLILENAGYSVLLASSAQEALTVLREADPPVSLLITDQTMPGMTGSQLIEEAAKVDPSLTYILSSGDRLDAERFRAFPQPVFGLAKPYAVNELQTLVRRALRARPPAKES